MEMEGEKTDQLRGETLKDPNLAVVIELRFQSFKKKNLSLLISQFYPSLKSSFDLNVFSELKTYLLFMFLWCQRLSFKDAINWTDSLVLV